MSLSVGELKKVSVQSIRDISAGLHAKAASMRATKAGLSDLPHKGTWTGVAADNAEHEIGGFSKGLGNDADAYENAAKKVDRAGDEFEGLKQLLAKLENEAAGKFSINEATGEVTPLTKDFNKSDRDYIANTLKQLCAAGGQANDDLAAAIHASDGATTPASSGTVGAGEVPAAKDGPSLAAKLKGLAPPNPDGDPGATKAAAATGTDTEAKYKEWYPKNSVPVGDKSVDPSKLGGLGAIPGVRDDSNKTPARMSPTLKPQDVPAFKDMTRQVLQHQGVPADQIEQRVNDAVAAAQTPHFLPDPEPMRTPGEVPLQRDFGDQLNRFTNDISDSATNTVNAQIQQAKELTGQAGPGAPGVSEAWKEFGLNSGKALLDQTTNPIGTAFDEAKQAVDNPADFIGKKMVEVPEALATVPLGGESGALTHGLEGGIERGLTNDLAHAPHAEMPSGAGHVGGDSPGRHTPSPNIEPPPAASSGADHAGGDHSGDSHSHEGAVRDHHSPLNDGGEWQSPGGGASLSPEHNAAANQFLEQARQAEPHITQSLRDIVGNTPGSELTGLEHRLKGEDSFKQKFFGSLLEDPQMSLDKHLAGMKDSVRYTMQSPEQLYTANTQRSIDSLIADGYEPVKFKNTWDMPGYQGINSFWRDPSTGQTFEVQFHTPSSFDAKMQTHPLYEQERLPDTTSQRIVELQREQKQIFDAVPRPDGSSQISLPPNGGHK